MKKIVVLTGAGMSAESGISTFRDSGGLWEQYPVEQVASHEGWERDPELVTRFYNERRKQLFTCKPNEGHRLLAQLEEKYDVTIITQNVDNLHEVAGSSHVIHLHGELTKVCSSRDVDDPRYIRTLTAENCEVQPGEKAGDGSLLRPYIVFFGEAVPNIGVATEFCQQADIFIVIGTSMAVYPAAGLIHYVRPEVPVYLIDPKPVNASHSGGITFIQKGASEGMKEVIALIDN